MRFCGGEARSAWSAAKWKTRASLLVAEVAGLSLFLKMARTQALGSLMCTHRYHRSMAGKTAVLTVFKKLSRMNIEGDSSSSDLTG